MKKNIRPYFIGFIFVLMGFVIWKTVEQIEFILMGISFVVLGIFIILATITKKIREWAGFGKFFLSQ